jgi:DNA-binding IclR family transcriptional regulator
LTQQKIAGTLVETLFREMKRVSAPGGPAGHANSVIGDKLAIATSSQAAPRRAAPATNSPKRAAPAAAASKDTADLTLRLLEYLAAEPGQSGVTELAQQFATSKATIYRHLRTLANRQFVRQDPLTLRYEAGIKLLQLGEFLRERFDILGAARGEMNRLRDDSGQAVTVSTLIEGQAIVLDLVQGRTVVEFGIRPGTQMGLHCSAHGKITLAFGPAYLLERCLKGTLKSFSPDTVTSPALLQKQVAQAKKQGWATAANEVVFGVNALAAPVFDHRGGYAGAIAIVGSTQYIGAKPEPQQVAMVQEAALRISKTLGWRGH